MKKSLLLSMIFIATALMSCNNDNSTSRPVTEAVFNTYTPQLSSQGNKVDDVTRYILAVYKKSDLTTVIHRVEQTGATFRILMEDNISYVCLFWADRTAPNDNINGTYNALDLTNIKLNDGKQMEEAFFARFDMLNDGTSFDVTLKRPTAQVNIVETDNVPIGSNIVITHSHYNAFNAFSADVAGTTAEKSVIITPTEPTGTLGSYLIFAPVVGLITNFTAAYNNTISNNIPNVPFKASFITNIRGRYAKGSQHFIFIIETDDVWEEFINGIDINVGTDEAPKWLTIADRNADRTGRLGAASNNSHNDHGYYYQWSNINNDLTNENKSYRACFDFSSGNGKWRLPTKEEWLTITGDDVAYNNNRKAKWDNGIWKLYDERVAKEHNFVYLPSAGYIVNNHGAVDYTANGATGFGYYWTSTEGVSNKAWAAQLSTANYTTNTIIMDRNTGFPVRCVKDVSTSHSN